MKTILCIFAAALILMSCATSKPAGSSSRPDAAAGGSKTVGSKAAGQSVKVPVETKAVYKFADGSVDEYLVSQYDAGYENLMSQSRFSAAGNLLEQVNFEYRDGRLSYKATKDELGKLRSTSRYQYNNQDHVIQEILEDGNGRPVSTYTYQYDDDGNRTSRIMHIASGAISATTTFVYNEGRLLSSVTVEASGQRTSSSEYVYDRAGRRITERVSNSSGEVIRIIETSWENNREIKIEQLTGRGQLQRRERNEYGPSGELLRKNIEDIQNKSGRIIEYEYAFREEHR